MLHIPPTNLLLLAAKQEPYKKAYLLTKNIEEISGKSQELDSSTREEIVKWDQMTALRFQMGGGGGEASVTVLCSGKSRFSMLDVFSLGP